MRICIPARLSDSDLTVTLARLVECEHGATARLVAHLAEFDARKLHLAAGFPSLFAYCCAVLHLSEPGTASRIVAARAARRFPLILDPLEGASVSLTTVRLLAPHLTKENHGELLAAATHKRKSEVEELIARRFPRADVVSSVRKVPVRSKVIPALAPESPPGGAPSHPDPASMPAPPVAPEQAPPPRRALVAPLAPDRYEIRFTASGETRDKLRRAQEQLSHAVPSGTWPRSSTGR
jgi:hypothetical protein